MKSQKKEIQVQFFIFTVNPLQMLVNLKITFQ